MDEREKIESFERSVAAWNEGDLGRVTEQLTEDHKWDQTNAKIPGETGVLEGHEAYLGFARRWRETLGPTQLEIEEARELPDGRVFFLIKQVGTGARSGASFDHRYVEIVKFEGGKATHTEIFDDERKGRAAAGLAD